MCEVEEFELLSGIAGLSDKWFRETVGLRPIWPARNPKRRRRRTPKQTVDIIRRELAVTIVNDVTRLFQLERCALLLPLEHKRLLWRIASYTGFPEAVLKRRIYRPGLGLTGRVLQGQVTASPDILEDDRRAMFDQKIWIGKDNQPEADPKPRAFLGTPIWCQPADLHREIYGALISVRKRVFSQYEIAAMKLVCELVSHGFQGLSVYQRRVEHDQRHAALHTTWSRHWRGDDRLIALLEVFRQALPFKRLLLSIVNPSRNRIEGRAVVGFREGLIRDTTRRIFTHAPADPAEEDILAMFVRERRQFPEIIAKDDIHVHTITALRHQVENDLLLIPLRDPNGDVIGVVLGELPDSVGVGTPVPFRLSAAELERFAILADDVARLIGIDRDEKFARSISLLCEQAGNAFVDSIGHVDGHSSSLTRLMRTLCEVFDLSHAAVYTYHESTDTLECAGAHDGRFTPTRPPSSNVARSAREYAAFTSALIAGHALEGRFCDAFPFFPDDSFNRPRVDTAGLSVALPLRIGQRSTGVLSLCRYEDSRLSAKSIEDITSFTTLLAATLVTQRTCRNMDRLEGRVNAQNSFVYILGMLNAINPTNPTSLQDIVTSHASHFHTLMRDISDMLHAELTELFLPAHPVRLDREGQIPLRDVNTEFEKTACYWCVDGVEKKPVPRVERKATTRGGLTASVLQTMHMQTSINVPTDEAWSGETYDFDKSQPRAWVGVPILHDVEGELHCWGVLSATRRRESATDGKMFSEEDLITARSLSKWIGGALARQYERRFVQTRTMSYLQRFNHDLPNIITHIENLIRRFVDATQEKRNEVQLGLENSAGALRACLLTLLELNGPRPVEPSSGVMDIERVVARLNEIIPLLSTGRGVEVKIHISVPKGMNCVGEEDMLFYALLLLVGNALRSCRERMDDDAEAKYRPVVKIRFRVDSRAPNSVLVAVSDNGIGFDHRLGDPNRIDEGVSYWKVKGFGVGRAIVRRIIEYIGGANLEFHNNNKRGGGRRRGAQARFRLRAIVRTPDRD